MDAYSVFIVPFSDHFSSSIVRDFFIQQHFGRGVFESKRGEW